MREKWSMNLVLLYLSVCGNGGAQEVVQVGRIALVQVTKTTTGKLEMVGHLQQTAYPTTISITDSIVAFHFMPSYYQPGNFLFVFTGSLALYYYSRFSGHKTNLPHSFILWLKMKYNINSPSQLCVSHLSHPLHRKDILVRQSCD